MNIIGHKNQSREQQLDFPKIEYQFAEGEINKGNYRKMLIASHYITNRIDIWKLPKLPLTPRT